jgi:hypothetical protein
MGRFTHGVSVSLSELNGNISYGQSTIPIAAARGMASLCILPVKVMCMFTVSSICLATLILLQTPASRAGKPAPLSARQQALAAHIDASIAPYYKSTGPGAVAIVVKDGQPLLRKAYGLK